jgi:Lrp/AsnC family transcriptional regulator, leucine-responsive regulatory protein
VTPPPPVDAIDRQILELLRQDARRTIRDIAAHVSLTVAPVKRRIQRMEALGVIAGYTVRVNQARLGAALEAVTELRFVGNLELERIVEFASKLPEVQEVLTIAGDPDALVRIRVDNTEHLQRVVNRLRTGGSVTATKTLVILESWTRSGAPGSAAS